MKNLSAFYIAQIAVNAGVVRWFSWDVDKILIFSIPLIAEFFKFALLKVVNEKKKNKKAITILLIEILKFVLVAVGLFIFVSPLDKENATFAIIYCVNFIIATHAGAILVLNKRK